MAQQFIGVGTAPNDGQGNPIRTAFIKCNDNFSELYARAQVSPPPTLVGSVGDFAGMYASDSSYFYYCFADYDGSSVIWAQVTQVGNVSLTSISSGTSNVQLADVNGNAAISVGGASNVAVFTTTGQLVTGAITATGNITGNYFLGNGSLLTGLPATYSNANVAAYLLTNTGNIAAGNVLVTSAVSATGNVTGGNLLSAGMISTSGNLMSQGRITASGNIETAGYFVGTFVGNVTGNFVIPGANTQVVFNTNGNADATAGMTFDTNGPNLFTVLGTISSQGNVVAGNITTGGVVTATGNVTGGNVVTGGLITATGNVRGGNFNTSGLITATGNVSGGNILTAGVVSATANITGGNIRTAGAVTATGNVSGGNVLVTDDIQAGGNVSATTHTGTSVSVTGNVTGGNIRTAGVITATGNITGNYFLGNGSQLSGIDATQIQNGNSNVTIVSAGSNVVVNVRGVSPVAIFANTGAYIQGLTSITGNVIAGNVSATAHTGTTVSVTGNVTGGNISFNSGVVSGSGNVIAGNILFNAGVVSGSGNVIAGNILFNAGVVSGSGNITGGNLSVGTGTITMGNIVNGNGNGIGNIGTSGTYFNTVFAQATSAQYADLAENYVADAEYAAGTVVVFGGEAEITISKDAADERVAGVISTQPAHLMNAGQPGLPVALRGRVPVLVIGPVFKGDSLVTSSTSGHAQSVGRDRSYAQAVFAKAIETNVSPGEKIIQAVIL
jgi:filamentous hemagglutinin